jgi:chorismate-pyruvate lyase
MQKLYEEAKTTTPLGLYLFSQGSLKRRKTISDRPAANTEEGERVQSP